MDEQTFQSIDQIIAVGDGWFYLQSIRNQDGEHNYTGYPCAGEDDPAPLAGHQPGQCYVVEGTASLESAATDLAEQL